MREDHFTSTPEGAAAFARRHAEPYDRPDQPTAAEAAADHAWDITQPRERPLRVEVDAAVFWGGIVDGRPVIATSNPDVLYIELHADDPIETVRAQAARWRLETTVRDNHLYFRRTPKETP